MDEIPWLAEAVLATQQRVFCAGTLAQCVRRWSRLSEPDQSNAIIKIGRHSERRKIIVAAEIADLAKRPEVYKI
jgi:hypothetical protein